MAEADIPTPDSDSSGWFAKQLLLEMQKSNADATLARREQTVELRGMRADATSNHITLLAAIQRVDAAVKAPPTGAASKLLAWAGTLPMPIQLAAAVAAGQLALNLSGAAYAVVVGSPPPQVTVPVMVTPAVEEGDDPAILYGDGGQPE